MGKSKSSSKNQAFGIKKFVSQLSPTFWGFLLFTTLFLIQFEKAQNFIPLTTLVNENILTQYELGGEYAKTKVALELKRETGVGWGYDPYLMAGYPAGTVFHSSSELIKILVHWLSSVMPPAMAIKWFIFLSFLISPFLIFFACRFFDFDSKTSFLCLTLAVAGFSNFAPYSLYSIRIGWHALIFSSYMMILIVALFYRYLKKPNISLFIGLCFLIPIIGLHKASILILGLIPLIFLYAQKFQKLKANHHLSIIILFGLTFLINWRWIQPALMLLPYTNTPENINQLKLSWLKAFVPFYGGSDQAIWSLIRFVLVFFGIKKLISLVRKKETLSMTFFIWVIAIGFFSLFRFEGKLAGYTIPKQFILTFWIVLLIPISLFLKDQYKTSKPVLFFFLTWFMVFTLTRQIGPFWFGADYYRTFPDDQRPYIQILKEDKSKGRILFEQPNYKQAPRIQEVGREINREMVGLRFLDSSLVFSHSTSFYTHGKRKFLFGHSLSSMNLSSFLEKLNTFNVSRIATFSTHTTKILDAYPQSFRLDHKQRNFYFYEIRNYKETPFLEGNGKVEVAYNQILINRPTAGRLVLKYHWIPTLSVSPGAEIKPFKLKSHPLPFIEVLNKSNLDQITIANSPSI